MRTKKSIRRAFQAAMPDVLHRVMEDCPAVKADEPSPAPVSAPMMPRNHWFKELVATAAALALLIGVAAGGLMFLRNTGGLHSSSNPTTPAESQPLNDDVSTSIRAEILRILDAEGAELEFVPSQKGEDSSYIVQHGEFTYEFIYDASSHLVVTVLEATGKGTLPPLAAEELVKQHLRLMRSDDGWYDPVVMRKEGLTDFTPFPCYTIGEVYDSSTSPRHYYYVNATNGQVFNNLAEMEVPAPVRTEILRLLDAEGAEAVITLSQKGQYDRYVARHEGFVYSFTFDSFDEFVGVDILDSTRESILTPQVAKRLLHQYLWATVDTEPADVMIGPTVVTEGELLTLDVGTFYRFGVSLNPAMSFMPSYYVEATTGDVYEKLPESDLTPPEEPWNILESRDQALLAVHLSLDEVYFLYGDFPANEDGAYYIRWWIKTENVIYAVNQSKDYQALDIASGDPSDIFHEVPDEWYPWQKARHISLEDAGVRLEDVTALDCSYMADQAWYIVTFTVEDVKYTYGVSAEDGSIVYSNFDLPAENYVSKEYALDLVARQLEFTEDLRDYVLSGEAKTYCTLLRDGRNYIYAVEIVIMDNVPYGHRCKAKVDALTGELLSIEVNSFVSDSLIFDTPIFDDEYDHWDLEKFNQIFGDQTSYYNWALVDPYTDITGLRLQTLFANAKSDGWLMPAVVWYPHWEESLPEWEKNLDHNFVPKGLMEEVLQAYYGVSLSDLPKECYSGMRYISIIGWYSCVASDYPVVEGFQAGGIEELENGDIALYYSRSDSNVMWVVTLRPSRNSNVPWLIVSNTPLPPA